MGKCTSCFGAANNDCAKCVKDKQVDTMAGVDMSDLTLPVIAVYQNPEDYPDVCVARIFDLESPTNTIMIKATVAEINEDISKNTGLIYLSRTKQDVKSLVCTWV